jgi:hypothetical protein
MPERKAAMLSFRARNGLKLIALFSGIFILSLCYLHRSREVPWVSDRKGFTPIPRPVGIPKEGSSGAKSEEWLVPLEAHIMYVYNTFFHFKKKIPSL